MQWPRSMGPSNRADSWDDIDRILTHLYLADSYDLYYSVIAQLREYFL